MNKEKNMLPETIIVEDMVDARQASYALRLPYYWFSDRAMRATKCVPHYRMGGLVRFRLSELTTWAANAGSIHQGKVAQ